MKFGFVTITWQDVLTFAFGLAAALIVTVGDALETSGEVDTLDELSTWGAALGAGLLTALLRYLGTYIPQWLAREASE